MMEQRHITSTRMFGTTITYEEITDDSEESKEKPVKTKTMVRNELEGEAMVEEETTEETEAMVEEKEAMMRAAAERATVEAEKAGAKLIKKSKKATFRRLRHDIQCAVTSQDTYELHKI